MKYLSIAALLLLTAAAHAEDTPKESATTVAELQARIAERDAMIAGLKAATEVLQIQRNAAADREAEQAARAAIEAAKAKK